MSDKAKSVKELFQTASPQDIYFLKRRPSLNQISKEILNFEQHLRDGTLAGKRINMGEIYSLENEVIAYNSFTIMQNATATPSERKYIDMGAGLKDIYFKTLYIHPAHRNENIGMKLIGNNLDLAKKLEKHCIADVDKNDYKKINILLQHEFEEDFNWTDAKGHNMIRFFHD